MILPATMIQTPMIMTMLYVPVLRGIRVKNVRLLHALMQIVKMAQTVRLLGLRLNARTVQLGFPEWNAKLPRAQMSTVKTAQIVRLTDQLSSVRTVPLVSPVLSVI